MFTQNWKNFQAFTRYSVHMIDLDTWWFKNFPCKQSKDTENISAGTKYCPVPCEHSLNEGFLNKDLMTSHLHTKKTQVVQDFSSCKSQGMAIVLLNS